MFSHRAIGVPPLGVLCVVGLLAGTATARAAVNIETVPVGNPGNVGDTRYPDTNNGVVSFGSVGYTYDIGKYEVTAGQYTAFLNAVGATDTYGLYNTGMASAPYGCGITQSGSSGSYTYSVDAAFVNRPVNGVSWGAAARFANWLHNGQPTGPQSLSTTEDGAYFLNGATSNAALLAVTRKAGWKWAITSEDEWYKAAYYDPNKPGGAGYWNYPTRSNAAPGPDLGDASGNNANSWTVPYVYPIDPPYYTTVVGQFRNSGSPYGTFDQGGNLWEWNEAVLRPNSDNLWYRGERGGCFGTTVDTLGASYRFQYLPSVTYINVGFRVAEVPEPATMVALAFGGLSVMRLRRR